MQDGEPGMRRVAVAAGNGCSAVEVRGGEVGVSVELVDLSVPLVSGMPVYPGDPEVAISPALTTAAEGLNVLRLHLGSQSGTHVDAPFHVDDALPRLDELPLGRFTGPAVVVEARHYGPRTPIGPEVIPAKLVPGVVVLVATGWSAHWGREEYIRHPYLAREAAEALVDLGVRTVGIDALSVDRTAGPGEEFTLVAHEVLCGAGVVIVENLTNLTRLVAAQEAGRSIETFLFPLPVAGADGAPVRAVARLG